MQYLTTDLKYAVGAKDGRLLLNDLSRYQINLKPINRVRGKNRYLLSTLGKAGIISALQKLCIPMSHVNEMFNRICWDTFEFKVDQLTVGHIDHLYVVFLTFDPEFDEEFTGIVTDPNELPKIIIELGNCTVIDVGDFLKCKLQGIL